MTFPIENQKSIVIFRYPDGDQWALIGSEVSYAGDNLHQGFHWHFLLQFADDLLVLVFLLFHLETLMRNGGA